MKPIDQTIFDSKNGDCFRACVASLLEMDLSAVPNFCGEAVDGSWWPFCLQWFAAKGYSCLMLLLENFGDWHPAPGQVGILSGPSPRHDGGAHATVGRWTGEKWEVIHDPHPGRAGLGGAPTDVCFVMPLTPPPAEVVPLGTGIPGNRDPDCPCQYFSPGKPSALGQCCGDGHGLCDECEERAASTYEEEVTR